MLMLIFKVPFLASCLSQIQVYISKQRITMHTASISTEEQTVTKWTIWKLSQRLGRGAHTRANSSFGLKYSGSMLPANLCVCFLHFTGSFGRKETMSVFSLLMFIYFQRERKHESERGRENPKQALHLLQGLISQTVRSWPEWKSRGSHLTDWATQVPPEPWLSCSYCLSIAYIYLEHNSAQTAVIKQIHMCVHTHTHAHTHTHTHTHTRGWGGGRERRR